MPKYEYPKPKLYSADVRATVGIHHLHASTPKFLRKYVYNYLKRGLIQNNQPMQIIVEYSQSIAPNKVEHDYVGRIVIDAFGKGIYWEGKRDYGEIKADGSIIKNKWLN